MFDMQERCLVFLTDGKHKLKYDRSSIKLSFFCQQNTTLLSCVVTAFIDLELRKKLRAASNIAQIAEEHGKEMSTAGGTLSPVDFISISATNCRMSSPTAINKV